MLLAPILLESSFQAQVLIPMATSLSFGLMISTVLVLMQVPVFYRIYFDLVYPGGSQTVESEELATPPVGEREVTTT